MIVTDNKFDEQNSNSTLPIITNWFNFDHDNDRVSELSLKRDANVSSDTKFYLTANSNWIRMNGISNELSTHSVIAYCTSFPLPAMHI
ncbi:CLUMA_CG002910, isoform A [Clunio marinus]|uniref:CLUMA_CG002910, isoform A n=1 Tax=Clunio marinus TaxID=568069 RepID=A0A1J1HM82_9DIPT|nr:CLUMA_CG002910, isoform A [Clunio marinus]